MKTFSIVCLTTLIVVGSLAEPAEAGRRGRRRAAIAVGVVAAATSRPVVVAAAPVTRHRYVAYTPDLTVTSITTSDEGHCVTVKNIGHTVSPLTQMRIDFRRVSDGVLVATKRVRVRPLRVNQSLRFHLHSVPQGHVYATAHVDPYNRVRELNEKNNDLRVEIVAQPPVLLEDVDVWVEPRDQDGEGLVESANKVYPE